MGNFCLYIKPLVSNLSYFYLCGSGPVFGICIRIHNQSCWMRIEFRPNPPHCFAGIVQCAVSGTLCPVLSSSYTVEYCTVNMSHSCLILKSGFLSTVCIGGLTTLSKTEEKFKGPLRDLHTVRKFNWWRYCWALCDEIFDHFPLLDETSLHIELGNSVISQIKLNPPKLV